MEKEKNSPHKKDEPSNGIIKELKEQFSENLTFLDLSHRNIVTFEENVKFPINLAELNLSHNHLASIPYAVLNLENIKVLNLSFNGIDYFDDYPMFCHNIVDLNLSNNNLKGPPYWVWTESPKNLKKIDLSVNINLTHSLNDEYLSELLQHKPLLTEVIIHKCNIRDQFQFFGTLEKVKFIEIGCPDYSSFKSNKIGSFPCTGLDKCCDVERLNLSNTELYTVEPRINTFKNLVEMDLSQNKLNSLPNNFCELHKLETCILSENEIIYLPEEFIKLKKLVVLKLDSNKLCMLPEKLLNLQALKVLDLYDNSLYEVSDEFGNIEKLDLAQNYLEEPCDEIYLKKKEYLRLNVTGRLNGSKEECFQDNDDNHTSSDLTDKEFIEYTNSEKGDNTEQPPEIPSSPEDWDSDDYWVPHFYRRTSPPRALWEYFMKQKMREGNFCPVDLHTAPAVEVVKQHRLTCPKVWTVVEGQFDDYSGDES